MKRVRRCSNFGVNCYDSIRTKQMKLKRAVNGGHDMALLLRYSAFLEAELLAVRRELSVMSRNNDVPQGRPAPPFVGACPSPSRIIAVLLAARRRRVR